ncbi:hypothetical protein PhaeoP97_00359 [Phaeobacter porticola]|uniref:Uncharacterized protein n=1 Tax=Phaeobacter porticola TaxID=1844006 RepID=A0A1L3I129_9RHOB|nr:hypothetical protein PhaeoP97_00359 [Phaeobacter porticola]
MHGLGLGRQAGRFTHIFYAPLGAAEANPQRRDMLPPIGRQSSLDVQERVDFRQQTK